MKIHNFLIIYVINLQLECVLNDTSSLKLVHIIFRHGDRTPTRNYKNDPHQTWPEGWGHLTKAGKKQMYNLGILLRKHYKDYLSEYYSPDDVITISSYADRTLMSAQMVLAGLYPPVKEQIWNNNLLWQPIPVRYSPRSLDNTVAQKRKCPKYDAAFGAAYKSERIEAINTENDNLYKYLTENTGEIINDIATVESLHNILEIEMLYNLPLPEWTQNVSMSHLYNLAAENLAIYTDNTLMKRLKGGPLLKEIVTRMRSKIDNVLKPDLDLILYSAHDITITTLLRTLGYNQLWKPDYGASVAIELHSADDIKYQIQLLYRENVTESAKNLEMEFCPTPCDFTDFVEKMQHVIPEDWGEECRNNENIL